MGQERIKKNLLKLIVFVLSIVVLVETAALYDIYWLHPGTFGLPGYNFYASEDYVNATGSWITDSKTGIIAKFPINTTEISCYKSRGICTEARAYKAEETGDFLAQLLEYRITKWAPEEVIAILDAPAGTIEIHFDITKKMVTLIESEKAEIEGARKIPAYAHMGNGQTAIDAIKK